jgi:GWxTD domain-containing protein
MPRLRGAAWRPAFVCWLVLPLAGGCGSVDPRLPEGNVVLADGPARWLMLPEEARQVNHLRGAQEAAAFQEAFWRRRDPNPATPGNELLPLFNQRVEAADTLYAERGVRGSLTDRGRALVLLGPPPILRYGQRRAPAWEPGPGGRTPDVHTRPVTVETWVYELDALPAPLAALLAKEGFSGEIELAFAVERDRTRLVAGEKVLDLAPRALVRE